MFISSLFFKAIKQISKINDNKRQFFMALNKPNVHKLPGQRSGCGRRGSM